MLKYVITVYGMKCGMCEGHINDTIRKSYNVIQAKSNRVKNTTEIIALGLDINSVIKDILALGYNVEPTYKLYEVKKSFLKYKVIREIREGLN